MRFSIVISAAQVVTAMGADKLAAVAGEAVAAGGANLAVMVDRRFSDFGLKGKCGRRL
jgi:hypothetical protein